MSGSRSWRIESNDVNVALTKSRKIKSFTIHDIYEMFKILKFIFFNK